MRQTNPEVFLISKPCLDIAEVSKWLDYIGVDAENLVMLAAKRCYMSFEIGLNPNIKKIRTEAVDYLTNILKVGHGSVLEHAYFVFAIENVSRVFTGEMNRHRAGTSISEGSMRFIRYTDIPYWSPGSISEDKEDSEKIRENKSETRELIRKAFQSIEDIYTTVVNLWDMDNIPDFKSKKQLTSMFRRIIPMGVSTGGIWGGNVRALRHIFTMRCVEETEEEIQLVATKMLLKMMIEAPILFKDFHQDSKGFWKPEFLKV